MRLFTALNLPEAIKEPLLRLQAGVPGAHWRPRENFHITLQFYGDVKNQSLPALEVALADIVVPEMELVLSGLGAFGKKQPFALWAGVKGASQMDQQKLHKLAEDCAHAAQIAGLTLQKRNYQPHLTLAYCTGVSSGQAARYFQEFENYTPMALATNQFHLMSSHLGKGPALYREEACYNAQ